MPIVSDIEHHGPVRLQNKVQSGKSVVVVQCQLLNSSVSVNATTGKVEVSGITVWYPLINVTFKGTASGSGMWVSSAAISQPVGSPYTSVGAFYDVNDQGGDVFGFFIAPPYVRPSSLAVNGWKVEQISGPAFPARPGFPAAVPVITEVHGTSLSATLFQTEDFRVQFISGGQAQRPVVGTTYGLRFSGMHAVYP